MLLIFLGLFVNALGQAKTKTAEETINEFWNLVLTDKIDDAMSFCDAKWFRNYDSAKTELESIKTREAKIQNILSENVSADVQTLYVNAKDKNKGQSVYAFYVYKRTATGEWKIVDFFKKTFDLRPPVPGKLTDLPLDFVLDCLNCI